MTGKTYHAPPPLSLPRTHTRASAGYKEITKYIGLLLSKLTQEQNPNTNTNVKNTITERF